MLDLESLLRRRTVSSLDVVALLNSLRPEHEPRLRHDHFMTKVKKVLGSSQFNQIQASGNVLQRREACLMVMSYGYDLQAKMLDLLIARW